MTGPIELTLWQSLMLLGLGAVAIVYVAYFRIWVAFAVASDLLFVLALALGATSIVTPEPFDRAAHALIERSPLPDALAAADARVAALAALPSELIDAALERVGLDGVFDEERDDTGETGDAPGATPTGSMTPAPAPLAAREAALAPLDGPFTRSIRPSVQAIVAMVLRGASFLTSGLLLFLSLATRASTTTARRLHRLTVRVDELESRLEPERRETGR